MKHHIGIISVTIIGATICQRELDRLINKKELAIRYTTTSCCLKKIHEFVSAENWSGLAELIIDSGKCLIAAGASHIIIPSNTPHYAIDIIQKRLQELSTTPIQVFNLIELTADHCARQGFNKVAVLGTKQTMQNGLYDKYLAKYNIQAIALNPNLINQIDDLIKSYLVYGKSNNELQSEIINELQLISCDGFILGCTELPEVYLNIIAGKPAIDTTHLLAQKAIEFIDAETI